MNGKNQNRLERQQGLVSSWMKNKYVGTIIACTGFGKTYTAIIAIKSVLIKRPNADIIVVVPTIYLQNQWEVELNKNQINGARVIVINTASKNSYQCDLLIIDEVHLAGAEQFSKVFETIKYSAILCLTATIERSDGREELIQRYAPIVGEVKIEEALKEGYVSNYRLYNIPVSLNIQEKQDYQKITRLYGYYEHQLGGRFEAWDKANHILRYKDIHTQDELKAALNFLRTVNKRKQFLYNISSKIDLALQIINLFPDRKTVVFSESIEAAQAIISSLPNSSTIYHSGLKSKEKKLNISQFLTNPDIQVLSSVKALDTGMDIPNISLGITMAGSSRGLQAIQRLGRTIRYEDNKIALFFNMYLKDSQEEKWIRKKCEDIPNVYWIDDLKEIDYE